MSGKYNTDTASIPTPGYESADDANDVQGTNTCRGESGSPGDKSSSYSLMMWGSRCMLCARSVVILHE